VQTLNDLLVPEWIESRESTRAPIAELFVHHSIDWVEKDGVEGISIKDVDGEILYFKPFSRRSLSLDTELFSNSSRPSADKE
jgi:hypothetical protein